MSKNDLPTPSGTFHQPADTALPLAFLMADQRQRWQRGERVFLESYFEQHPEWGESNELLLDLVYHEILVRERRGDEPTLEEYVKRFPHLANDLRMHFEVHTALGAVTPAEEGPDSSAPPTQIPGYEILERLGVGGMGVVYKARHLALDRIVALKMTAHFGGGAIEARQRLLAEARAVAALHHPHIVQIYEVGEQAGIPYFSMEYLNGGSLAQYLRQRHWPARIAAEMVECLARAIHAAHIRGIIHRDLKPTNVLLQRTEIRKLKDEKKKPGAAESSFILYPSSFLPKISDFGLAKLLDEDKERTRSGMVVGTPNYMAPEQIRHEAGLIGPATDVHALGTILYEMLTGVTPFRAASVLETLDQVLHEDPHSPRQLHSGVPRDLETICLKCLRKEPDRRYRSALDLAEDLRRFQADEPVLARPMGKLERGWRWCRRRPALAALLATVVVFMSALAVGAVVTSVWLHRERDLALRSEETALRSLRQSYLDQARLGRLNLSVGQRSRSLELLTEAARMMPGLDVRNETIACLARADWRPVREWAGNSLLCGVAFDGPLERYAHCGSDGTVTIRSALDDRELQRLDSIPLGSPPGIMVFSPKGRYLAGTCEVNREMKLIVWDPTTGRELLRLPSAPTGAAVAFAPQDDAVATAIQSKSIAIYEIPSGRERLRLEPVAAVDEIAFDAHGSRLALSSVSEKVAEVYDLKSRRRTQRLEHPEGVRGIGWSANGKWLATGCDDTIVYVWDVAHARLQATLPGHRAPIIGAKFNEEDAGIVTGSWDGTCRWWDLETRQTVLSAPGSNVYLAEGGRRMALSDAERLSIWEQATPEIRRDLRPRSTAAEVPHIGRLSTRSLDTAPGALLAVASEDGVHIWNTRALREACFLPLHECVIARFDPTGHYLAAIGDEGLFRWRYQLAQGEFKLGPREPLPVPINYRFAVGDLCWGPRGAYLLFSDYRVGKVRKVDLTGTPTVEDFGPLEHATSIARSPDGRWIASGAWQGEGLRIWDASSRKRITDIAGSRPGATSMRAIFSPDGGTLAACGQQEYRFLETGTWRLQRTLPRDRIESGPGPLAYHPDGRSLALVRTPGQVQILDRATYQELATLTNLDLISNLCFDADGSHLAVATAMNGLQWWDLKGLRAELERMGLNWED